MDEITEKVYELVAKCLKVDISQISEDDSLVDIGVAYSVGLIALINNIEKNYNIIVEDQDINLENFKSIRSVVNFIKSRI